MHVTLRTWALVIGFSLAWPRLTSAQDVAAAVEARLDVHREPNGGLIVVASNAPLDDVICAVAEAGGIHVTSIGARPRNRVTVSFSDRTPEIILRDMMNPAGVSYVLVGAGSGRPGRLAMGLLSPNVDSRLAAVSATPSTVPLLQSGSNPADSTTGATTDAPSAHEEPSRRGPTEWPAEVPPVNAGAYALPDSVEALFHMVKGTVPVSLPASMTPNTDGARAVSIESVNAFKPPMPFATRETSPRPGAVSPLSVATPFPPAATAIDPSMLLPPRVIQIPSPLVIQFPAPPR